MFDSGRDFDYGELLNDLACRTTEWLRARREELVQEQRRLHVEELAVTRVLDDRGAIDDSLAQRDGVSVRSVRDTLATARALEDLPEIAAVAAAGHLSGDQLTQVVKVVEPGNAEDDRRWAEEAAAWSPADLAHRARLQRTPTVEDAAARRAQRELRWWWRADRGMLDGRFSLPDVDGAAFETVLNRMVERLRPAKGEPWDTRDHRAADALVELARHYSETGDVNRTSGTPAPLFVVEVPCSGPATVAGVALPDAMVERLRAQARVEPVLVGEEGDVIAVGKIEGALSEKAKRVVRQRDGKCRWPGCEHRHHLEVHHLWPRSWGGTDDLWNLAAVCSTHHSRLAPQGGLLLLGNPNHPAGLALLDRDDLPALADLAATRARAGPTAA